VIDKDADPPARARGVLRACWVFFLHSPGPKTRRTYVDGRCGFEFFNKAYLTPPASQPAGRPASLLTSIARQFFVRVRSGFVAPLVVLLTTRAAGPASGVLACLTFVGPVSACVRAR
jgi:hypothetical protein